MKEYQFQYTKTWETLMLVLLMIASIITTIFVGVFNQLNSLVTIAMSLALAFLLYHFLKRKVVHHCTAQLGNDSIVFEFENSTTTINFNELISYNYYSDKNGPVLNLKGRIDHFKIYANNNFCSTQALDLFCKDAPHPTWPIQLQ